jgi:hypothetical protein
MHKCCRMPFYNFSFHPFAHHAINLALTNRYTEGAHVSSGKQIKENAIVMRSSPTDFERQQILDIALKMGQWECIKHRNTTSNKISYRREQMSCYLGLE